MGTLSLLLLIAALVLGVLEAVQTRGRSWPAWGVAAIALALLLPRLG